MADEPGTRDAGEEDGTPTVARGSEAAFGEVAHDWIGPYKLLEIIGEGGFGTVWLAERRVPMVQRVALKVIKPGMDSKAVIARFEQERQALAVMDHPNVAKVFDGGVTPTGRPYFVMEHVQGEPITAFCDRHKYPIRARLELFIPVCEAVQHAHHKGIIHRDIKPSNVLVMLKDGHAIPKVIDFGVAKAMSQTLTEKTIFTERGQLIGTPEYMSPEQAEMGATDIDTRTDVYSLGVVLYELLSSTLPFDSQSLRSAGYAEIQRIIREVDPPKPSTRLSGVGGADRTRIVQLRSESELALAQKLKRELEWIPMKAMRKDRKLRYETPAELGAEVGRYLNGQPLTAGPHSLAYRASKAVIELRKPFAWLLVMFAVLATTGVITIRQLYSHELDTESRYTTLRETEHRLGVFVGTFERIASLPPSDLSAAKRDAMISLAVEAYRASFVIGNRRFQDFEGFEETYAGHADQLSDEQIMYLLFDDPLAWPDGSDAWVRRWKEFAQLDAKAAMQKWQPHEWAARARFVPRNIAMAVEELMKGNLFRFRDRQHAVRPPTGTRLNGGDSEFRDRFDALGGSPEAVGTREASQTTLSVSDVIAFIKAMSATEETIFLSSSLLVRPLGSRWLMIGAGCLVATAVAFGRVSVRGHLAASAIAGLLCVHVGAHLGALVFAYGNGMSKHYLALPLFAGACAIPVLLFSLATGRAGVIKLLVACLLVGGIAGVGGSVDSRLEPVLRFLLF